MDFVVLGFGVGALAVLLGLAARDLGPMVRRVPRDGSIPWSIVAERVTWGRACRAGGLVIALAGATLCVTTGAALLARASDGTGMLVVLGGVVVVLIAIAAWAIRYRMSPTEQPERAARNPRSKEKTRSSRSERADRSTRSAASGARRREESGRSKAVDAPPVASEEGSGRVSAPADRRVAESPPMGALTVDAMGGFRRAPVTMPPADETPPPEPPTPTRDARGSRRELTRPTRDGGARGGRKADGRDRNR